MVSRAAGEDTAGSGGPFGALLALQIAPPWRRDVTESTPLPAQVRDAVASLRDAGRADKVLGLVPDAEYSRDDRLRLLLWRRPGDGPFALYEKQEYLVPEAELAALVRALADPRELPRFEEYREETGARDVLVCSTAAGMSAAAGSATPSTIFCVRGTPRRETCGSGARATSAATASPRPCWSCPRAATGATWR